MKADKITFTVEVECLSADVIYSQLARVMEHVSAEIFKGELVADDGDSVRWGMDKERVEF